LTLLEKDGLSPEILSMLSYKSKLDVSLKKNLHHYDKASLLQDVDNAISFYDTQGEILDGIAVDYRIKSEQSAHHKYERYYPDTLAEKVFNDLLGFRSLCDSYSDILALGKEKNFRVADMSMGKSNDDGYRGVHVYFQVDHYHYPIEIQYNTYYDRQLNNWLHSFLYKKEYDNSVGKIMRTEYELGNIKSNIDFEEVLKDVLSRS
jgi:putative GTP pyrophosphokinase